MILITKDREPESLTKFLSKQENKRMTWNDFSKNNYDIKQEISLSLCKEQGFICAYCMRGLDGNPVIEHYKCRDHYPDKIYDYKNLLAVDNKVNPKFQDCCENSKGNKDISLDPLSLDCIKTIKYSQSGEIFSSVEEYNNDINSVLNLNSNSLKNLRANTYQAMISTFCNINNLEELEQNLEKLKRKDSDGKLLPMCGLYIWYLDSILRKKFVV